MPSGVFKDLDETFQDGSAPIGERISPAMSALSVDALLPNPIIDVLSREQLESLLQRVDLLRFQPGEIVLSKHRRRRALYVTVQGCLEVRRPVEGRGVKAVDLLRPGDFFGEFELLTVVDSDAHLVAVTAAEIIEIPEHIVDEIGASWPEVRELLWEAYYRRSFHSMMAVSSLFSDLPRDVVSQIAVELEPLVFEVGDIVLRRGHQPEGLFGIVGGSLVVVKPREPSGQLVARLGPGDFFGVVSSASGTPSPASVVATEGSTLVWLPVEVIRSLRDRLPDFDAALVAAGRGRLWRYPMTRG
jgi:CRP-like cAMP-binding protein